MRLKGGGDTVGDDYRELFGIHPFHWSGVVQRANAMYVPSRLFIGLMYLWVQKPFFLFSPCDPLSPINQGCLFTHANYLGRGTTDPL